MMTTRQNDTPETFILKGRTAEVQCLIHIHLLYNTGTAVCPATVITTKN